MEVARFCLQTFGDQSCGLPWESPFADLQEASGITCPQGCLEGFRHQMTVGPEASQRVNIRPSIRRGIEEIDLKMNRSILEVLPLALWASLSCALGFSCLAFRFLGRRRISHWCSSNHQAHGSRSK